MKGGISKVARLKDAVDKLAASNTLSGFGGGLAAAAGMHCASARYKVNVERPRAELHNRNLYIIDQHSSCCRISTLVTSYIAIQSVIVGATLCIIHFGYPNQCSYMISGCKTSATETV